jgi:molybdopterin-guanine dinucleotide biosynthesis protein A
VAALEHATTDWNLMLAVDLPFLPVQALQALVRSARSREQTGAVTRSSSWPEVACILPQLDGFPQPLCGLYHRALAPGLRAALKAGKLKVMAALQEACDDPQSAHPGCRIEMWDAVAFAATLPATPDPSEWFLNINTPEDWHQARQLRSK